MEDITELVNSALGQHQEVGNVLTFIVDSPLLGRETLSAALGELSEHLVCRLIGGQREKRGRYGFDIRSPDRQKIEVKSRQVGKWDEGLMFDLRRHTGLDCQVYCIAWDDKESRPTISAAFRGEMREFVERWGSERESSYSVRTNLRKLRAAVAERT